MTKYVERLKVNWHFNFSTIKFNYRNYLPTTGDFSVNLKRVLPFYVNGIQMAFDWKHRMFFVFFFDSPPVITS